MLQSVTKMLRHLEQKGHLQTSPDSQGEIWYKKKKKNKSCTLLRFDVVHDTAAEQRCLMLDHMMDNFLLSW